MDHYLNISAAIFGSIGGAGILIFSLSNYLGKIWATRLMEQEKHEYSKELEEFRSSLQIKNDEQLASISRNHEISKKTHLREYEDKLAIYRSVIDIIATILAKIEMFMLDNKGALTVEEEEKFEIERLRIYGYLAMLAPQEVMDANDQLTDLLLGIIYDDEMATWESVRNSALNLTNSMRKDIGINKSEIYYNGEK